MRNAGGAWAHTPATSANQLEEIVVTAKYHEEQLQNTPISITAFSAQSLESRNLANITDVGAYVPNAVIQPLGAGWGSTMAAYIRGVGLGDNILSFEPGIPIYVDDVYIGRPHGAMFDLLDLERVEVLRGPQGTLFGKNAEGGTIRMISKKPQGDDSDRGYDVLYPCTVQNPNVCIHEQDDYVSQITENWAVFAHGTFQITDPFSITGGARHTSDKKDATVTPSRISIRRLPARPETSTASTYRPRPATSITTCL